MSGNNNYNRYYKPLAGNVLILPYPDEPVSQTLVKGRVNESGQLQEEQSIVSDIRKGVVVEKGKDLPGEIMGVKRKDVVMFPRGAGHMIKLKTDGEREFDFIVIPEKDIIAVI